VNRRRARIALVTIASGVLALLAVLAFMVLTIEGFLIDWGIW
jgi:hypothetical protein